MYRRCIVFVVMILFSLTSLIFSLQNESDREKAGLKGKVKTYYTYLLSTDNSMGDNKIVKTINHKKEYDTNGNLTMVEEYSDGQLKSGGYYSYDAKNNISKYISKKYEEKQTSFFGPTKLIEKANTFTYKYSYDNNKQLIKKEKFVFWENEQIKGDEYTYVYDPNGNLVEVNEFGYNFYIDRKFKLLSKNIYKYNEKGKLIEKKFYDLSGTLDSSLSYEYDDKDRNIKFKNFNITQSREYFINYEYDDNNNITLVEDSRETVNFTNKGRYEGQYNYYIRKNYSETGVIKEEICFVPFKGFDTLYYTDGSFIATGRVERDNNDSIVYYDNRSNRIPDSIRFKINPKTEEVSAPKKKKKGFFDNLLDEVTQVATNEPNKNNEIIFNIYYGIKNYGNYYQLSNISKIGHWTLQDTIFQIDYYDENGCWIDSKIPNLQFTYNSNEKTLEYFNIDFPTRKYSKKYDEKGNTIEKLCYLVEEKFGQKQKILERNCESYEITYWSDKPTSNTPIKKK